MLEAQVAIQRKIQMSLSNSQLVECDREGNYACGGGYPENAYWYFATNGLEDENAYPYRNGQGKLFPCSFQRKDVRLFLDIMLRANRSKETVSLGRKLTDLVRITGHYYQFRHSKIIENLLVTKGPVGAIMDATYLRDERTKDPNFIVQAASWCCDDFNHVVLIVGYGKLKGVYYWIVKNSWGEGYGDKGYFKIERSTCNIESFNFLVAT